MYYVGDVRAALGTPLQPSHSCHPLTLSWTAAAVVPPCAEDTRRSVLDRTAAVQPQTQMRRLRASANLFWRRPEHIGADGTLLPRHTAKREGAMGLAGGGGFFDNRAYIPLLPF